ncbi:acyl-CoA dehydrogenase, partial [Lactobacillus sp. XV13L]|nr:acyl-CoA dehydrogenase [Lactobacillus sp. XV13L]
MSDEDFANYLKEIRHLAQNEFDRMTNYIEENRKFPKDFFPLAIKHDLYRFALPKQYGGWGLSEKQILQVQEEFSRTQGGIRMHLHHASDMNWRILDNFGSQELKEKYMDKFQDKTIYANFALTEKSGGTGADLHTLAVKDGDDWVINGEKTLISHADVSDFTYLIVVTDPDKEGDERLSAFF